MEKVKVFITNNWGTIKKGLIVGGIAVGTIVAASIVKTLSKDETEPTDEYDGSGYPDTDEPIEE